MATLIITRGLPASGKSTRAKAWVAQDPAGRARVNRDDLRAMINGSVYLGADTEKQVQSVRDATIGTLLRRGIDVVNDDTNLPQAVARDLAKLAATAGATFEVWDLTDVDVEVCVQRDAARDRTIGEQLIRDMHARYLAGKRWPLPVPPSGLSSEPVPYRTPVDAPPVVLVDIDGTVALMAGRSPYDESRVHEDRPNIAVIAAVRALHAAGHSIIFCSGRTDASRKPTERWLADHVGVPYQALYMRAAGDQRQDSIVKAELFDTHIRDHWHVVLVLDDRDQVVRMWRSLGLTVFQVAPGDF